MTRTVRSLLATLLAVSLALLAVPAVADDGDTTIDVTVQIPSAGATTGERSVTNAVLAWALNPESGSGAYVGTCNFLSAGKAGDSGSAVVWPTGTSLYRATDGNVTIQKPTKLGDEVSWRQADWATRCVDESTGTARTVTTSATDYGTGNRVAISGGTGSVNPSTGEATIRWTGSFTVAFYGGMTYWWVTDPVLTVRNGAGTLTATAGGFGASVDDLTKWSPLAERAVTLATLPSVTIGSDKGFSAQPAYRGVAVTPPAAGVTQERTGVDWGAFPADFVAFQADTGQGGYWYSTGSARDFAKPPYPLYVSYSAADRVDDEALPSSSRTSTSSADAETATGTSGTGATTPTVASTADATASAESYPATVPDGQTASTHLIPAAPAASEDPRARLVVAVSGLAITVMVGGLGFRRRWLRLPWTRA